MKRQLTLLLAALALASAAISGCEAEDGANDAGGATGGATHDVTYVASEFQFDGPDTLPAGWTTVHLKNEGQELHHVYFFKLDEGKTLDDFTAYLESGAEGMPDWITSYGGPNAAMGPMEITTTLKLDAGNYVATCVIPGSDGVPHMAKGMVKAITVSAEGGAGSEPEADISVSLNDFNFEHSDPYTVGQHTVRVENNGEQDHELVIVKLDEGKTASDFIAAFAPGAPPGPPPGMPAGGTAPIAPGQVAYIYTNLTTGHYAVICFLDDLASGKIHAELGMVEEFDIQ
jgi:uncharacterized cupredoxin-like copper-binding protein